jgi:hypothetical protein
MRFVQGIFDLQYLSSRQTNISLAGHISPRSSESKKIDRVYLLATSDFQPDGAHILGVLNSSMCSYLEDSRMDTERFHSHQTLLVLINQTRKSPAPCKAEKKNSKNV